MKAPGFRLQASGKRDAGSKMGACRTAHERRARGERTMTAVPGAWNLTSVPLLNQGRLSNY